MPQMDGSREKRRRDKGVCGKIQFRCNFGVGRIMQEGREAEKKQQKSYKGRNHICLSTKGSTYKKVLRPHHCPGDSSKPLAIFSTIKTELIANEVRKEVIISHPKVTDRGLQRRRGDLNAKNNQWRALCGSLI